MVIECTTQLAASMLTLSLGLLRNVEDRLSPSFDYLSGRPRFPFCTTQRNVYCHINMSFLLQEFE